MWDTEIHILIEMTHMIIIMVGIHVKKCGRKFRKGDMDIDHIIPQKFGGQDSEWNLQCICKHCNRSKQASMRDTPSDLFASSKRIAKREISERKMIWDIAHEDEDDF